MLDPLGRQQVVDEEHLRGLRIAYLVFGGLHLFSACFGLVYVGFGAVVASGALPSKAGEAPPGFIGWFMVLFGAILFVLFTATGVLQLMAARYLRLRQKILLCQVAAALTCFNVPVGTVLGVLTFMVLGRPSVQASFDGVAAMPTPTPENPV